MSTTDLDSTYTAPLSLHNDGSVVMSRKELDMLQILHRKLIKIMDLSVLGSMDAEQARRKIREIAEGIVADEAMPLTLEARQRIIKQVVDEILGLGPLEPLLADPTVSDILVNSSDTVYVERSGRLEKASITFKDDAHLLHIIDRIVCMASSAVPRQQITKSSA